MPQSASRAGSSSVCPPGPATNPTRYGDMFLGDQRASGEAAPQGSQALSPTLLGVPETDTQPSLPGLWLQPTAHPQTWAHFPQPRAAPGVHWVGEIPVGTSAVGVGGQPSLCLMSGSRGPGRFRTDEQPRRWVLSPAELGPCFPGTSGREGGSVCSRGSLSRA